MAIGLQNPTERKIITICDVIFDENAILNIQTGFQMRTLFYCEISLNSSVEEGTSSGGISQSNTDYPKAVKEDSASNSSDNDLKRSECHRVSSVI